MTYDLFQMKNSLRAKSRMNTEQKGLLHESGSHRMPKYLLEQLDQQSIYEYTGNITG